MRKLLIIITLIALIFNSCRKDFSTKLSSGNLSFSKDTVYLDTVFTNIGSSTYQLKVYNKSNEAILIPTIQLAKGTQSHYRLNVDGTPGKQFNDVEILAKDSIYVFIETTIDYNNVNNPIYTDKILFDNDENEQEVQLVTLVKDANFLYPSKNNQGLIETIQTGLDENGNPIEVNGFFLPQNTVFTNEKPYVIYGYCAVKDGNTITLNAGANLYFHQNSGLIIYKNSSLQSNGTLNNPVQIEGDRLEPDYSETAGQWGTIWLRAGSKNNYLENTIIKNASAGIICDSINGSTPTLTLKNCQIYNTSSFGILGRETNIYGENVVVNNNKQASLACTVGGTYNFIHCTFANYWNQSFREFPSVLINNYFSFVQNNQTLTETRNLKAANFTNCIIDGNNSLEMILDKIEGSDFNFNFNANMIKFNDINNTYKDNILYDFSNTNWYQNNIINGSSDFKNPNNNELIIGENSDAINQASNSGSQTVPFDILGVSRTGSPDIGAYQHINFN
ncbi:MAG: hypothetical protein ACWA42_06215 [Lutibacter sp.]